MRTIGIDFGERRIGVAASDDRTGVAIPLATRLVKVDPADEIAAIASEERADQLVIGLPLSMTGAEGPQAQRVREVVEMLEERLTIPVHTWDERLTTVEAGRRGGHSGRARGAAAANQDSVAAAILLQAFVDSRRSV